MALEKNIKSLVHFMAFPGPRLGRSTQLGEAPEKYMMDSLEWIVKDKFFNGIEITLIKDAELRAKVADALKNFHVVFSAQPIQLINEDNLISPTDISSVDEIERQNAVARLKEYIDEAVEINARGFAFLSGQDPGSASGLRQRDQAARSLVRSIDELCNYADEAAGKKKKFDLVLEIFDRSEEKNMKNCLIGPTDEARRIAEEIKIDQGHANFGLLYDLSHMFLLKSGLEHETPDVLRTIAPYLSWVHIANSVLDKNDPHFGDSHVSLDYPNGLVNPGNLAEFVKVLNEISFQGGVGFEIMPYEHQLSESVVNIAQAMFKEACQQIPVNYALGGYRFKTRKFLPEKLFYQITELKINHPEIIEEEAANRTRRKNLLDTNLVIIAADHPARHVTRVGSDPIAMGDRQQFLGRVIRTLIDPQIDGVMATPDIVDDLFIINHLLVKAGGESIIDNKVIIGSTNRGGLEGSQFEMEDRVTAYTVADIVKYNLDGAKMLFRLDLQTGMSRYSQYTVETCARLIRECNAEHVPAFLEPLPVKQEKDGYHTILTADEMIKTINVATALGGSSSNLWLKIPYVPNYEYVARSTSNPILMLGGASTGDPTSTIENFEKGIGAAPNVRGCLVGRNLLYPGYDDPLAVSLALAKIIHDYATAEEAVRYLASQRGRDMDFLTKTLLPR